jgi:hypothetical protein
LLNFCKFSYTYGRLEIEMRIHQLTATMLVFAFTAAIACGQDALRQPAAEAVDRGSESLGGGLMDGLAPAVLPQTPAVEPQQPPVELAPELRLRPPSRFDDLGVDLDGGEDLGAPSGPLPLVRARQGMVQAGAVLAEMGNVADARAAQEQVIAQLDELINGLCKQCQGGGGKPGDKPPQASQRSQPKPAGGSRPGMSAIGPRGSTDEQKPPGDTREQLADREELIKQLWGHLPEREREQMLQSFSGEFLPKYELELEKYYRKLAEEQDAGR